MDAKWTSFLLAAILHTVASAPESVFALEGNSVTLIMPRHNSISNVKFIDEASWVFNQSSYVVKYYPNYNKNRQLRIIDPYKGRVEFDHTTFSLELTNLLKNDSGLYKGEINAEGRKAVSEYRLNVLDVTICNHSNPVSWHNTTVELEMLCQSAEQTPIWIYITVASGLVLLVLIGGVLCFRMNSKNQAGSFSAVYQPVETPRPSADVKRRTPSKSRTPSSVVVNVSQNALALSPVKSPSPIYYKVQPHTAPNTDLETTQSEHVYSFVP